MRRSSPTTTCLADGAPLGAEARDGFCGPACAAAAAGLYSWRAGALRPWRPAKAPEPMPEAVKQMLRARKLARRNGDTP